MDNNFNNTTDSDNNDFQQQSEKHYQNPYENNTNNNNDSNTTNYNDIKANEPNEGITSVILGALSIVFAATLSKGLTFAILAIINANKCRSLNDGTDTSNSTLGRILGIVGIVFSSIAFVTCIIYGVFNVIFSIIPIIISILVEIFCIIAPFLIL